MLTALNVANTQAEPAYKPITSAHKTSA